VALLDTFMPSYELREVSHVAVRAGPAMTWSTVRSLDLFRIPLVRRFFAIRLIPERIRARARHEPSPVLPTSTIDDIVRDQTFRVLGEQPGREIVVGAVGKVWQPRIDFVSITPETFASFETPGFAKVAWAVSVAPRPDGAWITIDLRVATTDPESGVRFRRYWRLIGRFSRAIRRGAAALFVEQLGPPSPDERLKVAGDELLPAPRAQVTHHVDIEAPPAKVWPWLTQMGRRRGGWYSWDLLDNGGLPSADRIIPALQKLAVGDVLPVKATGTDGFAVLALEPQRSLVLGDPSLLPGRPAPAASAFRGTWAFSLEPIGDTATHLVVRVRVDYEPTLNTAVLSPIIGAVHEVMERKQLRTLKQRAEAR
jgi:hypothetical protein